MFIRYDILCRVSCDVDESGGVAEDCGTRLDGLNGLQPNCVEAPGGIGLSRHVNVTDWT